MSYLITNGIHTYTGETKADAIANAAGIIFTKEMKIKVTMRASGKIIIDTVSFPENYNEIWKEKEFKWEVFRRVQKMLEETGWTFYKELDWRTT